MSDAVMTERMIFSKTEDEKLAEIIEESDEITGTLTIEFLKGKAVFKPDNIRSNRLHTNVIIDDCNSIEVNAADGIITLFNEDGKWVFDSAEK